MKNKRDKLYYIVTGLLVIGNCEKIEHAKLKELNVQNCFVYVDDCTID